MVDIAFVVTEQEQQDEQDEQRVVIQQPAQTAFPAEQIAQRRQQPAPAAVFLSAVIAVIPAGRAVTVPVAVRFRFLRIICFVLH